MVWPDSRDGLKAMVVRLAVHPVKQWPDLKFRSMISLRHWDKITVRLELDAE